jgi:phosphatidylserine/phosphatidylglycerophosphate/cardiolipin synthase-like enzyme
VTRLVLFAALAMIGCGGVSDPESDEPDPAVGFSATARPVIEALASGHAASRGETWDVSSDNSLDPGWILQTPLEPYWSQPLAALPVAEPCDGAAGCDPDFDLIECTSQADCTYGGTCTPVHATVTSPGAPPRSLCIGHSDGLYDRVYDLVTSAQEIVDISSLEAPEGRFGAALRNALTFLDHSGRAIRVRYAYGAIPGATLTGQALEPDQVVAMIARDLLPSSSVQVAVAALRDGPESWDHAKIIAIDRTTAIVGGHNLLTLDYLQRDPVFDLSMIATGSSAYLADAFVDRLWRFVCSPATAELASAITVATSPGTPDPCAVLTASMPAAVPGTGTTRIVGVGRLGDIGDNASDDALVALIGAAQTSLRISQQDIGGLGGEWPEPIIAALDGAVGRGVDVQFVMSNIGAYPDGLTGFEATYSNGWTPADVVNQLASYAAANPSSMPRGMPQLLCQRFSSASLRHDPDDAWPDGSKFANHAKLVIADDAAFYIGSHNLYPANLAEFGFIVDDAGMAGELVTHYYDDLWAASKRSAISGPDAATCVLQ